MLSQIHIRNFAIIDELMLECRDGLSVITGETGAGKSIMIGAIGLVLGERAQSGIVRQGQKRAEISLTFDALSKKMIRWLSEQDLEADDECVLRRIITSEGKSRCYINGTPTTLAVMRQAAEHLIEITGQNTHQSLLKTDAQRNILDSHAGVVDELNDLASYWKEWSDYKATLEALQSNSHERTLQIELIEFQLEELKELEPIAGEITTLHDKQKLLANSQQLLNSSSQFEEQLYHADDSISQQLGSIVKELVSNAKLDSRLQTPSELLEQALINIQEAVDAIRHNREGLELDPEQLTLIEDRLKSSHDLARKHKIEPELLPDKLIELEHQLMKLTGPMKNPEQIQIAMDEAAARYDKLAKKITAARKKSAKAMSKQITSELQQLGMEGSEFSIELTSRASDEKRQSGMEMIEFVISTNPGQPSAALNKVVSGGELSRVSLAIQLIAAAKMKFPTLIFDEVDAGIGGDTANTVGKLLKNLGSNCQVFCITHLAQVACHGQQHLYISKSVAGDKTATRLQPLNDEDRVKEIARMLGGDAAMDESIQHAKVMLAQA